MGWHFRSFLCAALALASSVPSAAQTAIPTMPTATPVGQTTIPMPVQSPDQALAQDADAIAVVLGTSGDAALHQLRLQEASVAATDAIAERFAARLVGISIRHQPSFGVDVLLTGDAVPPGETIAMAGEAVPVRFITGARTTHIGLVQAIVAHQATIRASLLVPPGMGVDPRTGEVVLVVSGRDIDREGEDALRRRLATLMQVPVRLRVVDRPGLDMGGVIGGARMVGTNAGDPRRYLCTSGFVVTDGVRSALATAAHCPDTLTIRDTDGRDLVLPFVGQWGWGHQDVQINASPETLTPLFFADTARTLRRTVDGARSRSGIRAGDVVCHRGERTGYSCAQVELTDFAPAGDLCGGACLPTWTTVSGPVCKSGDSGSPVFLGNTAFGILKGGSYRADGSCAFYFYMSTDYLPAPWRLSTNQP